MPARLSPPVLKETAPPPRPPKRGPRPVERALDDRDLGDEVEASSAGRASPPTDDDDPTKGEWLFKQNDMVLGPVTAIVLVERIKVGELGGDTPIARDGQPFQPMKMIALFREAHEATLERKKREAEERAYNAAVRRARLLRGFIFTLLIFLPAAAGAVAGRMVMVMKPWDKTSAWIAKAPPLVDLPPRPPEVKKPEAVAPPPAVASNDEPVAKKDEGDDDRRKGSRSKKSDRVADKGSDKADKAEKVEDKPADKGGDKGFVKELSNEQAVAPLKDSSVKGPLGSCFKAEMEANPDMPTQLVLAYTITEEGRSANVELTNRELRGRPVQDCVKKALGNARWPRFEGERKNVTVPFNIKKPPKPVGGPVTGAPR